MKSILQALGAICFSMAILPATAKQQTATLSAEQASRFAELALSCVHQEFPNKIAHVLDGPEDAKRPRDLYPVFYGCFDWHSSVHGHWLLTRYLRLFPDAKLSQMAREKLRQSFQDDAIAGEVDYLTGRYAFERPYGIAWFLILMTELREWDDPDANNWAEKMAPLENIVVDHFENWLPKLAYANRAGTHNQLAFGLTGALDWARSVGNKEFENLIVETANRFYLKDKNCPISYEPSGEDFLSPCLMEADLMRRILPTNDFAAWLKDFLPHIPQNGDADWLAPGIVNDPTDGKLVHLDGVNISRAWNLRAIADALPKNDTRRAALYASAGIHEKVGLTSVTSEHYEGSHWLGSFATYLITERYK